MNFHRKFCGMLLATTVLAPASGALAQDQEAGAEFSGPNAVIADEIVVRGVNIPDPQRATSQVATFLSSEDLARTGDDNAALALTRLSGLSIVGGKFAYVRGLGDRYSAARLNGSPLPSPEPLKRTVPLDLFPSNILQGAAVQKTYSPNYPGEFGGGIIDLETLRSPSEGFLNVKLGVGLNTVTTGSNGLFVNGGDLDWLGYDDGLRSVPGPLQQAIDNGEALEGNPNQEAIGESLVNSPLSVIQQGTLGPNYETSIDGGTVFDFDNGMSLGVTGVLGYKSDWTTEEAIRGLANNQTVGIFTEPTETSLYTTVNALLSTALEMDSHVLQLTGLYIHSTTKQAQISEGDNFNLGDGVDAGDPPDLQTQQNIFLERSLYMGQAAGEHQLGDMFQVNWRGSFARAERDSPYERTVEDLLLNSNGDFEFQPFTSFHRINFSELDDDTWSGGADVFWFIPVPGAREATLSAGYEYVDNDRDFGSNPFQFITNTSLPTDVATARVDFLFSPDNIDPSRFRLTDTATQGVSSYIGELLVHAAYAQIDAEIIPTVRTTVGVRYEDAEQSVDTFDRFGNLTNPDQPTGFIQIGTDAFGNPINAFNSDTKIENDYWLPSATVTWNFTDNMQLRAGYSHTIARPQFRELAASAFLDPETDRTFLGNPFLQDSEFRNYDLRYEYYLGRNQFFTVAGFYKEIDNPIEEIQFPQGDFNFQTTFINSPKAELYGGEVEFRSNFEIPWNNWFQSRDWLFSINYTFTESEIQADADDVILERDGTETPGDTFGIDGSQLAGTPKHIVNSQFGWENENTQFTILLGWVSERLLARGERGDLESNPARLLDVFERPGIQLDAVFRQNIVVAGTDMTIGLSARNLLGESNEAFQINSEGRRTEFNTYERGRSLSASLTARF